MCQFLEKYEQWQIYIIGSPEDRAAGMAMLEKLPENIRGKVRSCCGEMDLNTAFELIAKASLFVSVDSAPLHYARLKRVPAVSLWGARDPGILLRPQKGYPEVTIYNRQKCSPCVHRSAGRCPEGNGCVGKIAVEEVFSAVEKVIPKSSSSESKKE